MRHPLLVLWCPPDPAARRHPLVTSVDLERAGRFRLAVDADRHLTARVLARRAAAHRLGITPAEVRIAAEPHGRPLLHDSSGTPLPLHLSITHAGAHVGIAIATAPVGLDVQDVAALSEVLDSELVWTPGERADLAGLPLPERLCTAASWWTAKEAVLKSLGRGLLDPAEELEARHSPIPWLSLDVDPDHAAAIASAGGVDRALTSTRLGGVDDPITRG